MSCKTKKDFSELSHEVQEALLSLDKYYVGVIPWLANMYDGETGGFYMTMSGKLDPEMAPGLEMTSWAVGYLKTYSSCFADMPADFRENLIKFFRERQDPKTGLFIDKQGPTNARETARNQGSSIGALTSLGAKWLYPHPSDSDASELKASSAAVMPPYMDSVESYIGWIESLDWEKGSWFAGDQVQSSQHYVAMLPDGKREEYTDAAVKWLNDHQCENGFWSPNYDFNAASGAFKVCYAYDAWGLKMPNHDKMIESIFKCYKVAKTNNPFYVRNPISVLEKVSDFTPDTKEKIQKLLVENMDAVVLNFGEFLCPDGAFSAGKGRSMLSFGGVVGSHELNEGDIDATFMMLIAREQLYSLFDVQAPPLDASEFWDWIYGKKPMPDPYASCKHLFA